MILLCCASELGLPEDLSAIEVILYYYYYYYLYYYRRRVCVFAKFDQFLPVRSHFDTKRPVNFFHVATFQSATFGRPLFAFVLCVLRQKIIKRTENARKAYQVSIGVIVDAKLDQFLPVRSQFASNQHINSVRMATFQSANFGPLLFAFYCPLLFTKTK